MKHTLILKLFLLLGIFCFASCSMNEAGMSSYYRTVSFTAPEIPFIPDEIEATKSALNTNPIGFTWEADDTVGIFPNQGSQVFFSMESGAGTNTATFDGGGWALKEQSSYFSYYPLCGRFYLNPRHIPVSFIGQKQSDATSPFGSARFVLAAKGVSDGSGSLLFNYSILNVILNVNCTLPAGVYTGITLETQDAQFTTDGYFNLFSSAPQIISTRKASSISMALDNLSLSEEAVLPLYIMLAPVNLNGVTITVTVTESTGRKYVCEKVPSRAYLAGSRYGLTCNAMTEYAAEYPEGIGSYETDLGNDDEIIIIK